MTIHSYETLPLVSYKAMMDAPLPEIPWIVSPLFSHGDRFLLYGEWGSYKSWLLAHLGIHVAAGKDWLGKFSIPKPKSVLYVDEEMSETLFRTRIKLLGEGVDLAKEDLPFQLLSRAGVTFDQQGATNLLQALDKSEYHPEVVIVETLRRVLVGDEKEAQDIGRFWSNVEPLIQDGRALIVSHHMKKAGFQGGSSLRDRASGSTDIMAGVDGAIALERCPKDTSLILHHVKSRASEEGDPFQIKVDSESNPEAVQLVPSEAPVQLPQAPTQIDIGIEALTSFFHTNEKEEVQTKEVIEFLQLQGLKERTAERAFQEYRKRNPIRQIRQGCWKMDHAKDVA